MTRSSAMLASFGFVKTTLGSANPRVASPDLTARPSSCVRAMCWSRWMMPGAGTNAADRRSAVAPRLCRAQTRRARLVRAEVEIGRAKARLRPRSWRITSRYRPSGRSSRSLHRKRDTKNGPWRQGPRMALPSPFSAHGDQLISAKPRGAARLLSDLHM
jgi:hypothetical protein